MKLIMIMARLRPRRARPIQRFETDRDWSIRDWADLPIHHPRNG